MNNDTTLHYIYRIVNFMNGKSYIGKTNRQHVRRSEHFTALKKGKHTNRHLQAAYDLYGRSVFYYEVLERNISEDEIDAREIYWIGIIGEKHELYNLNPGGRGGGVGQSMTCTWNRVKYPSRAAAERATRICKPTLKKYLDRGYTCDADIPPHSRSKPITWNGITYSTIQGAEKALGKAHNTLHLWLKHGFTCDEDVEFSWHHKVMWNGIEYPTIAAAAKANNVTYSAMKTRVTRHGYNCDADIKHKLVPIVLDGVEYPSISAAARAIGVDNRLLHKRLKKANKLSNAA